MGWQTPVVNDASGSQYAYGQGDPNKVYLELPGEAQLTGGPTPKTPTRGGQEERHTPGGGLRKLEDVALAAGWATPASRDHKDSAGMSLYATNPDGSERVRLDLLPRQVLLTVSGPTPSGSTVVTGSCAQQGRGYTPSLGST